MTKYLRPCAGKCLVEPIPEDRIQGSIVIPETAYQDMKSQFVVKSVGKGLVKKLKNGTFLRLDPEVKAGDRIVASTYAGKEVVCDDKFYRLIHHDQVLAIIDPQSPC